MTVAAPAGPRARLAALERRRREAIDKQRAGDLEGALAEIDALVADAPRFGRGLATGVLVAQSLCAWDELARFSAAALDLERTGGPSGVFPALMPFTALGMDLAPSEHRSIAERYVARFHPPAGGVGPNRDVRGRRIRLGYLSADIRHHPVMHLGAGLFDHHDRDRFDITCFSTAPSDGSAMRERVVAAVDRFVDLADEPFADAVERLHQAELDVVIDLSAHTEHARLDLLATRPAPLQVHYLGYPGTTGAPYVDAFIADAVTVPAGAEHQFTERVVRLDRTYQINDPLQRVRSKTTRRAHGLPDDAFVMASFNSSYKVEPVIFHRWMAMLRRIPNAVLWLMASTEQTERRLSSAVRAAGIEPERVVFAAPIERTAHLARVALADVCLDTYLVGGHTTTSDALRAGVPVVTAPRAPFISRVSASLLTEAGLVELIATDLPGYEDLVAGIAADPRRRRALRRRVRRNVAASKLFDPAHATAAVETVVLDLIADHPLVRSDARRSNR